ncbi:heavy metal-binding domain-containing protein [Ornatilinea apprima]|uniref:heavy metal-binding domain-containing protein n=1 Tax=Ornatilinea apprima TaxID=1134406 RepID=UPI0009461885|nr:heavy metal-binding domain-containing protein [Ornatilinea apprima]
MKTKDVATQYGLDKDKFEAFLRQSNYKSQIKDGFLGMTIDDGANVSAIIGDFKKYEDEKAKEDARLKKAEEEKKAVLASMLITSGFNFDGYTITKYSGYISGDDAISVDRGMSGSIFSSPTNVQDMLMESLVRIRRNALAELKEAAYALGCNAVIGVDFDYLTLDPQTANAGGGTTYLPYVFGVTANGNAVVIEKIENFKNSSTHIPQTTNMIAQEDPVIFPKSDPREVICPKCHVPMIIQTATNGENQGKKFYVCPNYKQCQQFFPVE